MMSWYNVLWNCTDLKMEFFLFFIPFFAGAVILIIIPQSRLLLITGPIFHLVKKKAPKISTIERQAIEAGTDGFDRELFSGKPNWDRFRAIPFMRLTDEEQTFLNGPTRELCDLINDWEIRGKQRAIPNTVWDFAKHHGFLGLRVSKSAGGKGFSAQAKSVIMHFIASRSFDVATIIAVSNSLGPDELLEKYGTVEQKKKYLQALVSGKEIACFAITSPVAGSDVTSMQDVGRVVYKKINGKKTLGLTVSWSKRYITLAPNATLIVLAFRLLDPDTILDGDEDRGITLALIPTNHPGVHIGKRHLPGGAAFPNGPLWGKDVFIPLEWVLGGKAGIGEGWKMIMQNLAAGRGVSLPSMSTAAIKMMLLTSSAYARVRRQFNKPIGIIEGVEAPLARITEAAYLTEAARAVTSAMVTREDRPLVIASIMKYQMTEYARRAINDAMDIHGGKGVVDGPSNYLQSAYQMSPVAITVEGSNIITRSLIVIGQAVMRSHPYFKRELESFERGSAKEFDQAFSAHIASFIANGVMSVFHNLTCSLFARQGSGPRETRRWYRALAHASKRFAFLADMMIFSYQGLLKKKQHLGGRLTDAFAELYLLSCVLKRFEDDGAHVEDYLLVEMCLRNGLYRFESSINSLIENISFTPTRWFLRVIVGTWIHTRRPAPDSLNARVVSSVLAPNDLRRRLTRYVYVPDDTKEPIGMLEQVFEKASAAEEILVKVERAARSGVITRVLENDWIREAVDKNIITEWEGMLLREVDELAQHVIAVDHFDPSAIHGCVYG